MRQARVVRHKSRVESEVVDCRPVWTDKTHRGPHGVEALVHEIDVVLRSRR